jgi:tyrosyl-tRNA synthetase
VAAGTPAETPSARDQLEYLTRNAAEVVPRDELLAKLQRSVDTGRGLRVKLGLDPTAADVTLGWAVVLRKLREFQDLGHTAVLIVGDFTAQVGDPSGKSETRPRLDKGVVKEFAARLLGQFEMVVSRERLEVRYNAEWLDAMDMEEVLRLTASTTVARMLERDDFAKRFTEQRPISVMEFLYPLLQARDSVAVEADVELGGNDQLFNLLAGRDVQRVWGQEPQVALTMPLLEGLDGVHKMSQSLGNYVGVTDPPEEMFGKLMSIPDELIVKYLRLCTPLATAEIEAIEQRLSDGSVNPNEAKRRMAREIVALYHAPEAARAAEDHFNRVFREHAIPEDILDVALPPSSIQDGRVWLPRLLADLGLVQSNSDGRRQVEQGAVRIDGEPVQDAGAEFAPSDLRGRVLQVGRRRFVRIARARRRRPDDSSGPAVDGA